MPDERRTARPLTFARVFWHFSLSGWGASVLGLVVVPRLLARRGVEPARIDAWSLAVWLGLLLLLLAPLARDAWRAWIAATRDPP